MGRVCNLEARPGFQSELSASKQVQVTCRQKSSTTDKYDNQTETTLRASLVTPASLRQVTPASLLF